MRPKRWWHWLAGVFLLLVGMVAVTALTFYLHPLFVITQVVRFSLFREGAVSRYAKVCVASGCYQVHYYVAGEGPPVVLIHGVGGSGENWAQLLAPIKRAGFRVYFPDLLGFGRSERPDVDYSMRLQAEVLHAFLLQQNVRQAYVGGVSMGGWVALKMAAEWPDSVARLLLFDSAGTTFAADFQASLFEPRTPAELQGLLRKLTPHPPQLPDYVARDLLQTMTPDGWVIDRAMRSMFSRRDLLDSQLAKLPMPTLIVWGREDRLIPLTTGELMHQAIRRSELQVYEGCGHMILEVCSPQIAPKVVDFLSSEGLHLRESAKDSSRRFTKPNPTQ